MDLENMNFEFCPVFIYVTSELWQTYFQLLACALANFLKSVYKVPQAIAVLGVVHSSQFLMCL